MTDWNLTYCGIRSRLEDQASVLLSKFLCASERLHDLVGKDHPAFVLKKSECARLREQLVSSKTDLQEHRTSHGC